jgi:hypothetical protein
MCGTVEWMGMYRILYDLLTPSEKVRYLERMRRKAHKAIAAGRCYKCRKRKLFTSSLCRRCNALHRKLVQAQRNRRRLRRSCVACGGRISRLQRNCDRCRRKRRRAVVNRVQTWKGFGLCLGCGKAKEEDSLRRCRRCRAQSSARHRRHYAHLREQALARLGHACCCCGELRREFHSIDHVRGDGHAERKVLTSVKALYLKIKRAKFLGRRYQILCFNCNLAKANYGYCPHSNPKSTPFLAAVHLSKPAALGLRCPA